ncbi:SIMPL domain-containing protein [Vibrio sp. RC27]
MIKAVFIAMTLFTSGALSAAELKAAHIATTGIGEVSVAPDSALFNVQVEQSNLNAEQAKSAVDDIVKAYIEKLVEHGESTEKISSSNLFLSPQYYYPKNGQPDLIGYKAVRKITVDVDDISKLNLYLDVALEQGVTSVNRIELKVKDRETYRLKATQAAIADAKSNAKLLAEGFGRELGDIWEINYQSPQAPHSPGLMRSMSLEQSNVFKDYQDTNIVIKDNVNVIYELK